MGLETRIDGDPASVRQAASWLRGTLAPALDRGVDALLAARRTAEEGWLGQTGSAFAGAMGRGAREVEPLHTEVRDVGASFDDYAGSLESCQQRMAAVRSDARAAGLTVTGTVVEDPGPGPARPTGPPEVAHQSQVDAWDREVAAYDEHQARISAYHGLVERVDDIWLDLQRAWDRVSARQRALDGASWAFTLTDVAGGLSGALGEVHASALRGNATYFKGLSEDYLARLAETGRVRPGGAPQFYDDLDHYRGLGSTADDGLASASRAARVAKFAPIGVGGLLALGGTYYDYQYGGESIEQAAASNLGGFAASVGTGALVGTAIGGPVGTVVGTVVGAGVGVFTSGMIDGLFEHDGDVGEAFLAGVDTLVDTGEALADVGGAVVDGIGGLFD